ncbi:MAG: hypothetical protein ABW218_08750, partial [Casimicrobiaceae bacterium]
GGALMCGRLQPAAMRPGGGAIICEMTTPDLLRDATREFLRRHAPFDRMTDDALAFAIPQLTLAYFARDRVILSPASGPVTHLYIVHRGRVGARVPDPRAEPEPTLGPGE